MMWSGIDWGGSASLGLVLGLVLAVSVVFAYMLGKLSEALHRHEREIDMIVRGGGGVVPHAENFSRLMKGDE